LIRPSAIRDLKERDKPSADDSRIDIDENLPIEPT